MLLDIDQIRIGKRLRQLRPERVAELAQSIDLLGLMTPISVASAAIKRVGGGNDVTFELVAGLHRLEACKSLGFAEIEASVVLLDDFQRELWEIDENYCRVGLTELERGEILMQRKEVYERKYPQTKQHVAGAVAANAVMGNATTKLVAAFVADTKDKTSASEMAIRRSIRRVVKIDKKVRDRVRALPGIADSGVELDALADLDPAQQKRAVALVEAGQANGIRDARRLMQPAATKLPSHFKETELARQKRRDTFVRAWNALDHTDREWARLMIDGDTIGE